MRDAPARPTPADLALLAAAVARDQRGSAAQRAADDAGFRDHAPQIGRGKAVTRAVRWARFVSSRDVALAEIGDRARAGVQALRGLAIALGLALGVAAALAVFSYDGSGRINVILVLAVFVFGPLLMLVPLAVAMLPASVAAPLPGVAPLGALLRALSPGRWVGVLARVLPGSAREPLEQLRSVHRMHGRVYAHVEKWALLSLSQSVAACFSFAAIAAFLALVVFSDLAFGWSTTLDIHSRRLSNGVDIMGMPWDGLVPNPSRELVAASQFYRLDDAVTAPADAQQLGAWWPFLLMSMICYGLLPRLLVWGFCEHRLRSATARAVLATPGIAAVMRRLDAGLLRADGSGAGPEADATSPAPDAGVAALAAAAVDATILWAQAPGGGAAEPVHAAGGARSLDDDRALLARLSAADPRPAVAVRVKAWEPPMLELLDFLGELREALGDAVPIQIVPVGDASAAQRAAWPRVLAKLGDPWLGVAEGEAS